MIKSNSRIRSVLAVSAFALLLAAPSAFAECGDSILDEGEACDGEACCAQDCTLAVADTVCRPAVAPECDVEEVCSGADATCPANELVDCGDTDGLECTVPTCNVSGTCVELDECIQTCRGPGYWGTHSGNEKDGENIGQSVIDTGGALNVCGQVVSMTNIIGELDSSLEGLCVRTQGVKERQLYRHLLTAAFNCSISEGGSCDQILDRFVDQSFTACNALCTDGPVEDGPTLNECKQALSCFNKGGRIVDGKCARGTCAEEPEVYCGANYGSCPTIDDAAQACVRFEDNCRDGDICNDGLETPAQICPDRRRASSPKTCKDARKNDCTIDSCGGEL